MRLMLVVGLLGAAVPSLPAQAEDPAQLVAQLAGEGRAAAHRQLVALGAKAVPALMSGYSDKDEDAALLALGILREIGPDAGSAVPALVELVRRSDKHTRGLRGIVQTLAELAPFRDADVSLAIDKVSEAVAQWSFHRDVTGGRDTELWLMFERLRMRAEFPMQLPLPELLEAMRACNAWRVEIAVELVGRRGQDASQALPRLQALLACRDPRVLTTALTVPIRDKAARAILAITEHGPAAEQARAVLAGGGAPDSGAAVPERARARVVELIRELSDASKREAASANLVAMDTLAAMPLVEELQRDHDVEFREAALAVLQDLGPRAARVVPALLELVWTLPTENTVSLLRALKATAPYCRDVVPSFWHTAMVGRLEILGRRVPGTPDVDFLNAFNEACALMAGAMSVDPGCTVPELRERLASKSVLTREAALEVVRLRGAGARRLLPDLVGMLEDTPPELYLTRWLGRGVTRDTRNRTEIVRGKAARAILAVATPDDPAAIRARELLAETGKAAGK
jgi:hypothetical protein